MSDERFVPKWNDGTVWNQRGAVWGPLTVPPTQPGPPTRKGRMTNTPIEKNIPKLITQARNAYGGADRRGAVIGLKQNTAVKIKGLLDDLVEKDRLYDEADGALKDCSDALTNAVSNGHGLLKRTRDRLKAFLGDRPSAAWKAAGWSDRSIAVPSSEALIVPNLDEAAAYLGNHAECEDASPQLNVTAVNLAAKSTAIKNARAAYGQQDSDTKAAFTARDAAARAMRSCLSGLLEELNRLLDPFSPEYASFGFKCPGAPDAPDAVENTRVVACGGGAARVTADRTPRADTWQFWAKIEGVDAEFQLLDPGTPMREPDKTIPGFTVGATVTFKMRASNETGEGPFGDEVRIVIT